METCQSPTVENCPGHVLATEVRRREELEKMDGVGNVHYSRFILMVRTSRWPPYTCSRILDVSIHPPLENIPLGIIHNLPLVLVTQQPTTGLNQKYRQKATHLVPTTTLSNQNRRARTWLTSFDLLIAWCNFFPFGNNGYDAQKSNHHSFVVKLFTHMFK